MDEESTSEKMCLSSILDLKSELQKKQAEAAKLNLSVKESKPMTLLMKEKEQTVKEVQNKTSKRQHEKDRELEETKALDVSRQKMEAKAKLYDKIKSSGLEGAATDLFLVDFEKKSIEEGKSNKLTLKGLGDLPSVEEVSEAEAEYMERQRKKWTEEEIMASLKDHVTYQDVLFDEARTHGAGYYAFSRDEAERAAQKASLEAVRMETLQKQKEAAESKSRKEKLLKERLKKVREKKRLQMGLPLEETEVSEDENLQVQSPAVAVAEAALSEDVASVEAVNVAKPVRPWDIGKVGVTIDTTRVPKKVLSQEEWVDQQRSERRSEFAPPIAYQTKPSEVRKPTSRGSHAAHSFFARQKFPPVKQKPATDKSQDSNEPVLASDESPGQEKAEPAISRRMTTADVFRSEIKQKATLAHVPSAEHTDLRPPEAPCQSTTSKTDSTNKSNFGSRYVSEKQRNEKLGKTLRLYSTDITTNSEDDMRPSDRNKSAIPPPACMDYYTSGKASKAPVVKRPKLQDSISAGLSVAEKKRDENSKKKDKGMLALF